MNSSLFATLQRCWERLSERLESKREELRKRESSIGKSHDVAVINRLRGEITRLEARLDAVERQMAR